MSTYDKIAWLPLCGGLTGIGLVLSYLAYRRRGLGSGLRWAAWSLLPIAAYLTGSIEMFWKMGVAIGDFAKGFAFSPRVWSGQGSWREGAPPNPSPRVEVSDTTLRLASTTLMCVVHPSPPTPPALPAPANAEARLKRQGSPAVACGSARSRMIVAATWAA